MLLTLITSRAAYVSTYHMYTMGEKISTPPKFSFVLDLRTMEIFYMLWRMHLDVYLFFQKQLARIELEYDRSKEP